MRPCDCKDIVTVKKLNEQGIRHKNWSIWLRPNSVTIETDAIQLKIPMNHFRRFAEWFLEDQEEQ